MVAELAPILTALYSFYNVVFQPLLALGPYASLGFFSVCLAGLFSLIYWHFLDIEKADKLKEKMSHHQDKMKEARSNDKTDKASKHMQKSMEVNQELMKENFKPMIGTLLFVTLIFPWLGATFAPTVQLAETSPGMYEGNLTFGEQTSLITVNNSTGTPVVEYNGQQAKVGEYFDASGVTWDVKKVGEKSPGLLSSYEGKFVKVNAMFVKLPFNIPILAGNELNWLGFYILIAMPLTYVFRKLLGVA
ncbi:EMC3/TMCO1 family protein [Candidatus Nanohalococcus occultus]|uniref:EMC3/TMCO1 family protein n=1 Tax=Candidatus Nanohalococcus occultus TaxID=2978047 RepID=UPI0039E0AC84